MTTASPANSRASGLPAGLPGVISPTRYVGSTASVAPVAGTFAVGDFVVTQDGKLLICTVAGTPGTWVQPGGAPSGAAGGDLTGTYPNPTLAAAGGGAAGPTGSATVTPIVTVDAKGRVTALSSATILPTNAAGGELAGNFPNPTLSPLAVSAKTRDQAVRTATGIISETFNPLGRTTDAEPADGTAYFAMLGLLAGEVATSLSIMVKGAGIGVTLSKVGLYSKTGTRLAISADQGSAWESTGLKTIAFTAPYNVPTTDGYFAAYIAKASVTVPTLVGGGVSTATAPTSSPVGAGIGRLGRLAAQTDLPSSATVTTTADGVPTSFYAAVS